MAKQRFQFQPTTISNDDTSENMNLTTDGINNVETIIKKLETPKQKNAFEIKIIPRHKIRTNKKNNYPIEDIESLMDTILHFGLLQPINVVYLMDEDIYCIEAGHRRCESIDRLIRTYQSFEDIDSIDYQCYLKNIKQFEVGYPCNVVAIMNDTIEYDADAPLEEIPEEVVDSEIRLIITNEEFRNLKPFVRAQNVNRLSKLYERKNLGKLKRSEKININQKIAENLNITERQVINYKNLDKLVPELKEEFEKNNITLKTSSSYARLTEDEQYEILAIIKSGNTVSSDEVQTLINDKKELLKKIQTKEDEIKKLTATTPTSEEQMKQNEKIKLLEQELNSLKAKDTSVAQSLSVEQAKLLKLDLQLKTAYDQVKGAVEYYLKAETEFLKIHAAINEQLFLENLCTIEDLDKQKKLLITKLAIDKTAQM